MYIFCDCALLVHPYRFIIGYTDITGSVSNYSFYNGVSSDAELEALYLADREVDSSFILVSEVNIILPGREVINICRDSNIANHYLRSVKSKLLCAS